MTDNAFTKNQPGGKHASPASILGFPSWELLKKARGPYGRLLDCLRPHRFRFATAILLGILAGVSSMLVLVGLQPILALMLGNGAIPRGSFPDWPRPLAYAAVCALLPALVLVRGVVLYLHAYCMLWVGNKLLHTLRDEIFTSLMRQSLNFYHRSKTGELIQLIFNQTRLAQDGAVRVTGDLVLHSASILCILGFLFFQDWRYTLAGILLLPACILPVIMLRSRVREAALHEEAESGTQVVVTQEVLNAIRVVKTHAREDYERRRFLQSDLRAQAHVMRWHKAVEMAEPLVATIGAIGVAAGLVYAKLTHMSPELFILLNAGLAAVYPHAKALSRLETHLEQSVNAAKKVFAFIDQPTEILDAPDAVSLADPRGEITFTEVRFGYPGSHDDAIRGCNVTFGVGRSHALVGRSGSGKSTLLSLLLRFHDPRSGSITFDGIDLRQIKQSSLRDHIGVVNQDIFLFRDTLYNNILYGNPGASKEEVIAAAQRAFAHEFILEKSGGYEAVVGEPGCTLTGGQQQRISIARAFLRNAPVLLVDEAYSSLDPESEKAIQAAIEDLSRGKIVIAIPIHPATVLSADEVLVMDAGRIVEAGTHEELLTRSEIYRQLYHLQFRSHDLASPSSMATV